MSADYRQLLMDELSQRREKNPRYSLRALARDLGVSVTALSQVLSSKRGLSKRNLARLVDGLCLSPAEASRYLERAPAVAPFQEIEEDTFRMMSDWYYFAILSLARLKTTRSDPHWLARRIGITPVEARTGLERLIRLGLVKAVRGKLTRTCTPLKTTDGVPSAALRKFNRQLLQLAMDSIERDPINLRQNASMTMAIDPARLEEAKEKVLKFRNELCAFLEAGTPKEVYTLAIQLFPISRSGAVT